MKLTENFKIIENGFCLTDTQRIEIRRKLQQLERVSPAMSTITLEFNNTNQVIEASLTINNYSRKFRAKTFGNCPSKIYSKLSERVNEQLVNWKKTRFLNETLGLPRGKNKQLTGGYAV